MNKRRLVLSSQSPRRSELLTRAGFEYVLSPTQISEIPDETLNLQDQIEDLARRKAEACLESGKLAPGQGNLILSADTVVVLDGQILGKPQDRQENQQYLRRLSGRTHSVITAVCLLDVDSQKRALGHMTTEILFRELSEADVARYGESGEGLDKAGGYGIQGAAGAFVAKVDGAFDNVVGLPVALVERMLEQNGWIIDRKKLS